MESERCVKCGAPVGSAAARCPLCGADQYAPQGPSPSFQPATVGLQERRAALEHKRQRDKTRSAVLALVGAAGLLLVAGLGYAGYKMMAVHPPSAPPPPPPAPSVTPPLVLEGVAIANPGKTDPTDLLPSVRKRVTEGSPDYRLVEIAISRARNGTVDLTRAEPSITYRYLYEQSDPRVDKKQLKRERADFTLKSTQPVLERTKPAATDEPVQDPLCVWSAAWRAAVASGFPADLEADARYARRPKTDKSYWVIQGTEKPETRVELDGISCSIKLPR